MVVTASAIGTTPAILWVKYLKMIVTASATGMTPAILWVRYLKMIFAANITGMIIENTTRNVWQYDYGNCCIYCQNDINNSTYFSHGSCSKCYKNDTSNTIRGSLFLDKSSYNKCCKNGTRMYYEKVFLSRHVHAWQHLILLHYLEATAWLYCDQLSYKFFSFSHFSPSL